MNKKGAGKQILIIAAIILFAAAIYFTFFFHYKCKDLSCFRSYQEKCSKAEFVNDGERTTWFYQISGKSKDICSIKVQILKIKEGSIDQSVLEGESMDCYLLVGDITTPESDLKRCHGLLKENLQEIMIKNAHKYIAENIGTINKEINSTI